MTDGVPLRGSLRSQRRGPEHGDPAADQRGAPAGAGLGTVAVAQILARIMDSFGPSLAGTRVQQVDSVQLHGHRVVGEWVWGSGVTRCEASAAIYFIHGSGYALCSPRTHRRLTAWLSRLTGLPVFCVDCRLAPRHRFPTAADDVRAGWEWLVRDRSPESVDRG